MATGVMGLQVMTMKMIWIGAIAVLALACGPQVVFAAPSPPPVDAQFDPEVQATRNECRASCGVDWVKAQACVVQPKTYEPPSKAVCKKRAQKAYDSCLVACTDAAMAAPKVLSTTLQNLPELQWISKPDGAVVAVLPHSFNIPAQAWAYAAQSRELPTRFGGNVAVAVDIKVLKGRVGVLITSADGALALSPETVLSPSSGRTVASLLLEPRMAPASLVIRNYDNAGVGGEAIVYKVEVSRPIEAGRLPDRQAR